MEDIDQLVRRVDEDRWLASRFAPAQVRKRLIAIYAVNYELARIRCVVSEPALRAIRLAWWRDALADIHEGKPSTAHPALRAYAHIASDIPGATWGDHVEARAEAEHQFTSWSEADAYFERTTGALMRLAVRACGEPLPHEAEPFMRPAAVAWGILEALRLPAEPVRLPDTVTEALARAKSAYQEARMRARLVPSDAFPAFGYLALASGYLRVLARRKSELPLLARQIKLVGASATGRI